MPGEAAPDTPDTPATPPHAPARDAAAAGAAGAAAPSRPRWWFWPVFAVGALWTSPWTAVGLLAGLAGMPAGASMYLSGRDRALVFRRWPWGPGGAMTLGNVVLATGPDLDGRCLTYEHRAGRCSHPQVRLGDHERAHVYQYMALGPLFVPLYFLCGGISVRNRFERAADHYAIHGHGWWPWTPRSSA